MSTCINREVSCPGCGAVHPHEMWIGIERSENPELYNCILEEALFDWKCPDCGEKMQLVYPCLYHDRESGVMICLSPKGETEMLARVPREYPQLKAVTKRLVSTPAELKEKLLIFEAGLNDLAVEMVKLALIELMEQKRGRRVERALFTAMDQELDYLGFSFFLRDIEKPVFQGTKMEVYQKSLKIAEDSDFEEDGAFMLVDSALAQTLLESD